MDKEENGSSSWRNDTGDTLITPLTPSDVPHLDFKVTAIEVDSSQVHSYHFHKCVPTEKKRHTLQVLLFNHFISVASSTCQKLGSGGKPPFPNYLAMDKV